MSDLLEPAALIRLAIALLAALGFLVFAIRINDDWAGLTKGWRVTRLSLLLLVFVAVLGTVEIMLIQPPVPLGVRNALLPVSLVGLLIGMWLVRKEPAPTSVPPKDPFCTFPGCIAARIKMRELAVQYPDGVPPRLLLDVVEGVEAHEHHDPASPRVSRNQ